MPRPSHRPATSGYARLTQADEADVVSGYMDDDDVDEDDPYNPRTPRTVSSTVPIFEPIQPGQHGAMSLPPGSGPNSPATTRRAARPMRRRPRRNSSGVDIKALNARLERWADEIAARFKIHKVKGKSHEEEQLEIHHTVFQPPEGIRPISPDTLHSEAWLSPPGRMSKREYDETVESVRNAIELGVHPIMISQGSSGSYFARNSDGTVVGVFKPKDEEPYASRNPKWTKWIHRNLFPCFFGRACLIPNLSYVSEAAAYTLDCRLCTGIVPATGVIRLSSKSFFYDLWQRSAFYRKRKPLPQKPGSFQVFLNGYKDATKFFNAHPWPDDHNTGFRQQDVPARRRWNKNCTPNARDEDDELNPEAEPMRNATSPSQDEFQWTDEIQQSFREELEKLVVLDYIMRNTDRGLDNWMIKVDQENQKVSIVSEPIRVNNSVLDDDGEDLERPHPVNEGISRLQDPYRRQEAMTPVSRSGTPSGSRRVPPPNMSIGAIDNSLSWPWKHPDAWRSFPFGWLFLPVSLIGQPFSQRTREHFLPLLTSTEWWSGTQIALRHVFEQDSDFQERMFARQIAVMKGQAWNVVETLKIADHGPLELTRRSRVCVWDDLVDIPIAIPLRTPPADLRRPREPSHHFIPSHDIEEEMDISAANGPIKVRDDLLRFSPPPTGDLPNPNRFSLSRHPSGSGTDITQLNDAPGSPSLEPSYVNGSDAKNFVHGAGAAQPGLTRSHTAPRPTLEGTRHRASSSLSTGRFSFSARRGMSMFYDEEEEGDLGYAAARVTEKHTRKVIVERLETVKSKNPFFTWC